MKSFDAFGPEDKEPSTYELSSINSVEELLGKLEIVPLEGSVTYSRLLFLVRIMRALACL